MMAVSEFTPVTLEHKQTGTVTCQHSLQQCVMSYALDMAINTLKLTAAAGCLHHTLYTIQIVCCVMLSSLDRKPTSGLELELV